MSRTNWWSKYYSTLTLYRCQLGPRESILSVVYTWYLDESAHRGTANSVFPSITPHHPRATHVNVVQVKLWNYIWDEFSEIGSSSQWKLCFHGDPLISSQAPFTGGHNGGELPSPKCAFLKKKILCSNFLSFHQCPFYHSRCWWSLHGSLQNVSVAQVLGGMRWGQWFWAQIRRLVCLWSLTCWLHELREVS